MGIHCRKVVGQASLSIYKLVLAIRRGTQRHYWDLEWICFQTLQIPLIDSVSWSLYIVMECSGCGIENGELSWMDGWMVQLSFCTAPYVVLSLLPEMQFKCVNNRQCWKTGNAERTKHLHLFEHGIHPMVHELWVALGSFELAVENPGMNHWPTTM